MKLIQDFVQPGKMSFVMGGQWGSEGKGAAAAWLARMVYEGGHSWDVITTNAGAQAGHTSIHKGKTVVVNHLPTAAIIAAEYGHYPMIYLNAGCIIDVDMLAYELAQHPQLANRLLIHPNAVVITPECKTAEMDEASTRTKIGSTRKGVGEALARKVQRYPEQLAKSEPRLQRWVGVLDLNHWLMIGKRAFCEVPQGHSLSVNSQFYPYTTSRVVSLGQALADADVHPRFAGETMLVLRSLPIRVGNIQDAQGNEIGYSGDHFADQKELSWEGLGLTPEITTVTKRVRRVFSFSEKQVRLSMAATRPRAIYMTFCDYIGRERTNLWHGQLKRLAYDLGFEFDPIFGVGPSTDDVALSTLQIGA